jgi:hypothetical protein
MTRDFLHYLPFLAKTRKVLVYSDRELADLSEIFDSFYQVFYEKISNLTAEKSHYHLIKDKVDTVVIFPDSNYRDVMTLHKKIKEYDSSVDIVLVIPNLVVFDNLNEIINSFDAMLAEPFSKEDLAKKLFTVLSNTYSIKSISNREISLRSEFDGQEGDLEEFLDTYEGSILFLSEELGELSRALGDGALSHELLFDVATKMEEVSTTFGANNYTKHVSPIFDELASFLRSYSLESVDVEVLEGFDYLARIIDDVSFYITEYFVDRIFTDVYIFEHSLENSIKFMEDKLMKNDSDQGELEFF